MEPHHFIGLRGGASFTMEMALTTFLSNHECEHAHAAIALLHFVCMGPCEPAHATAKGLLVELVSAEAQSLRSLPLPATD